MADMKELFDKWEGWQIRKAQNAISAQGDVANVESVRTWLEKRYPKKKGSLLTGGAKK